MSSLVACDQCGKIEDAPTKRDFLADMDNPSPWLTVRPRLFGNDMMRGDFCSVECVAARCAEVGVVAHD